MGLFDWLARLLQRRSQTPEPPLRVPHPDDVVHTNPLRCPLNAPGPFYSLGQCMACGLPEGEASELLAPLNDANATTYFVRQPATPDEVRRACMAIHVCCICDLRYGGTDAEIIRFLGNDPRHSDYVIPKSSEVRIRDSNGEVPDGPVV